MVFTIVGCTSCQRPVTSAFSVLIAFLSPTRTRRSEMGQETHRRVWQGPRKSHDVRRRATTLYSTPVPSNALYSWGPSAGGLSVGSQLVANGGDSEGLFRAALLSCGSLLPTGDISDQQPSFDSVVTHVGCGNAIDKLNCLRGVPAENLTTAAALISNINLFSYGVRAGESYTSRSISGMLTQNLAGCFCVAVVPSCRWHVPHRTRARCSHCGQDCRHPLHSRSVVLSICMSVCYIVF